MKFCDLLDGVIKMMKKYERGLDLCIVSDGISPLLMKFLSGLPMQICNSTSSIQQDNRMRVLTALVITEATINQH
jgi:hypothetical protein